MIHLGLESQGKVRENDFCKVVGTMCHRRLQTCYIYLSIRLHQAFLFKYNNNKYLRTCKNPW